MFVPVDIGVEITKIKEKRRMSRAEQNQATVAE